MLYDSSTEGLLGRIKGVERAGKSQVWSLSEQASPVVLLLLIFVGFGLWQVDREPELIPHSGYPQHLPATVAATEAIATAINNLHVYGDGWRLDHPRHAAIFSPDGVDFHPRRGPDWRWRLEAIGVDGAARPEALQGIEIGPVAPVSSTPTPMSSTHGSPSYVSYERGVVEERYVLREASIEQQFVLHQPLELNGADLMVAGTVSSDGAFEATERGWLWRTAEGVVSLGDVSVFDITGARIAATMEVAASSLRIVVNGAALARAVYPVLIDPEIGTNDFRISETGGDGDPSVDAADPAVAYNSLHQEYLVVWQADDPAVGLTDNDFQILGQRIDATTGLEIGPAFRISDLAVGDPAFAAYRPAVVYSASSNEYLVVWAGDAGVPGEFEIFGQRLDADPSSFGAVGANDFRISDMGPDGNLDFGAFRPAVAFNAVDDEYLVVWTGDDNPPGLVDNAFEVFGQRLDADPSSFGEVGTNDFRISDMGSFDGNIDFGAFDAAVAFNRQDREYLVVWDGDDDTGPLVEGELEIFGQRLNADPSSFGEVGTNDFRISDMGIDGNRDFGAFSPAVAHNSNDNEYLVVWQGDETSADEELEIFGQRLDGDGAAAGANDFQVSDMGPSGSTAFGAFEPEVTHNGVDNEYLVVWHGDDNSLVDGEFEIFGQQLTSNGGATGVNDFRISDMGSVDGNAAFDALRPAVVYDAARNQSLVVWQGDDDSGALVNEEFEIYGQFLAVVADLEINADVSLNPVLAGTTLTYTLTVTNNGPDDADNVVVTDTLPAGVTFLGTTGCSGDPVGVPSCGLGTLGAGFYQQVTIMVTVDAGTLGVLSNIATVTSDANELDPSDNTISIDTAVIAEADLSVTLMDSQDPVAAGAPLSYSVMVSNSGPSNATNVTLTENLPVGVTFVSTTGCLDDPVGVPSCDLGTIMPGSSSQVTVAVSVDASSAGPIINSVSVTSDTPDPDPGDNAASEETFVDHIPPTVTLLNSQGNTGDGELVECENTKVNLTRLLVTFSEDVRDPPGNSDPDDVTNPGNYRLIASGPDHDFATSACGPVLGDDEAVVINSVLYDDPARTAKLSFASGLLGDSLYRLMACGSTAIRDIAGNPLDGDGDGAGGGDFVRTYRVDQASRFENSFFDCSIDDWLTVSPAPGNIVYSSEDVDGSAVSGSARVTDEVGSGEFSLGQCVATQPLGYRLSGWINVDAAAAALLSVSRVCEFFPNVDCGGRALGIDIDVAFVRDTGGDWIFLDSVDNVPDNAVSALCSYDLRNLTDASFEAYLDSALLESDAGLFADGFESGNTSAWSLSRRGASRGVRR